MTLPVHTVHVPAGQPIDEAARAEHVGFGTSHLAVASLRQGQRGSLTTRSGYTYLPLVRTDATSPTVGSKVFTDGRTAVRITDGILEAYSSQAQAWSPLGRVPEVGTRTIDLPSLGTTFYLEDVDATNGYFAVSWVSVTGASTSTYVAVFDQGTGATLRAPEIIFPVNTDLSPAMLGVQGNYFIAVRYRSTGTKLEAYYLDTTSAATIATGWVAFGASLCADAAGVPVLCSLPHVSTPRVAVLYPNTGGGASQLTVRTINVGGVVETQTVNTGGILPTAYSVAGNATDTLWVAYGSGANVFVIGLAPFAITTTALASLANITSVSGAVDTVYICPSSTAGKARVCARDGTAPIGITMRGVQTTAGAAASDGTAAVATNVSMVRKPFFYSGRYYSAFISGKTNAQQDFIVCDWTDTANFLRPVANPSPGLAAAGLDGQCKFVAGSTATSFYVGYGTKRSTVAEGCAILELDFASTLRWQSVAQSNTTFLSGGLLSYFDGVRVGEASFCYRPATPTATVAGTGITGTFRYIAVYEEVDADGNWHQSGLSDPSASVVAANQTVTVTVYPLAISSRLASTSGARGVRVAWYRTATGGVAPYYRLGTTLNDTSVTTTTFADAVTDATLTTQSKLYRQIGVNGTAQDHRPPPGLAILASYNGLLVGAEGSNVWYSGQDVSGEGTWFSPIFQVPVPGSGDITGLAVQDGTLFVFKRGEIYAIAGEPPSDNGASGGLGVPRRLAVDVGCIESRSVCVTAAGIFFQSARGIEVLTRSQSVAWIGEAVRQTLASYPIVTSAVVEPVANVVYIELAASQSGGAVSGQGRTLVYNLVRSEWESIDRRKSALATTDAPSQSAAIIYTGTAYRYAWLSTDGYVHIETPGSYLAADGTFVATTWETSWIKHGLQQEQMVWAGTLLFERLSACGLTVETAYDYGAYAATKTWTEAETLGKTQLEFRPRPRGQAMKFRVTTTAPAVLGTGRGMTFVGLSIDTAPMQGSTKGTLRLAVAGRK